MITRNYYLTTIFALTNCRVNYTAGDYIYRLRGVDGNLIPNISNFGKDNGGTTSCNGADFIYLGNHLKIAKSALACDTSEKTSTPQYGVCFGNGTAAESFDSYTMAGELFTTYSVNSTDTYAIDDNGATRTIMYTLTNTGTEDFTISEVGYFGYVYRTPKTSAYRYINNHVLLERTLLETPITIPANGGVGQVTYTIRLNYPV